MSNLMELNTHAGAQFFGDIVRISKVTPSVSKRDDRINLDIFFGTQKRHQKEAKS